MTRSIEPEGERPEGEDDGEGGFDLARLKQLLGFFARAARRHPTLAITTAVFVSLMAIAAAALMPRSYSTDVRIMAQRNLVLPALGNPRRAVPNDADNPTRGVADTIMKRDNIVALVKQLNLVDRWDSTRPSALRLKDALSAKIFGPLDEERKLQALVGMLETRLMVQTDLDSVTITVDWSSPDIAYELVTAVQKNFLEARYDAEIAVISEAISILEARAKGESENVDTALGALTKLEQQRRGGGPPAAPSSAASNELSLRAPGAAPAPPAPAPVPLQRRTTPAPSGSSADASLTEALEEKRRQIKQLEDDQRRRLAEAQSKLSEVQVTLGPLHPTVLDLQQKIEALRQPPPELLARKEEERAIAHQIAEATAAASRDPAQRWQPVFPRPIAAATASSDVGMNMLLATRDDATTAYARQRLQAASFEYTELLNRIDSAKIELDVARASFKYRYSVVRPPSVPSRPRKPNVPLIVFGGIAGAILLGILLSGIRDIASGRFIEVWQVERRLKLPVLGDVNLPRWYS